MFTMLPLLMINLARFGYISWKRTWMKCLKGSKSLRPCQKASLKNGSRHWGQIMEESSHQMNSMIDARKLGLRGSLPFPIIHDKMFWNKGRIYLSWKLWNLWYMINIYQCTYGKKQLEHQCMYRIEYPTVPLGTKL